MLTWLRQWREDRRLARLEWPDPVWEDAVAGWSVAQRYQGEQRRALRDIAVVSEAFFEKPEHLGSHWPAVYAHLCSFYRQDPAGTKPPGAGNAR